MRDYEPIPEKQYWADHKARIKAHRKRISKITEEQQNQEPVPEVVYLPRLTSQEIYTLAKRRQKQKFRKPPPRHPDAR